MSRFVFFDEKSVRRALDAKTRKALSRFGAFVRTRAKSSIRKRKSVSKPGNPPSSHTGKLKKYIYFGYDRAKKSVVIGALPFSNSRAQETLEHGGSARTQRTFRVGERGPLNPQDVDRPRKWARLRSQFQASRAARIYNRKTVYRPRPFMKPAFQKELANLPHELNNYLNR
ncbi:MAG: hypothetical protein II622_07305 [Thermoguttaceae bacterium]|nr:hypothetical protein [Thermoguttaceae bacterium]